MFQERLGLMVPPHTSDLTQCGLMTDTLMSVKLKLSKLKRELRPETPQEEDMPIKACTCHCTTEGSKNCQKEFHCIPDRFDDYMEQTSMNLFSRVKQVIDKLEKFAIKMSKCRLKKNMIRGAIV
jgi:hypothetical protein